MRYIILILFCFNGYLFARESDSGALNSIEFDYLNKVPQSEVDTSFLSIIEEITFNCKLRETLLGDSLYSFSKLSVSCEKQTIIEAARKLDQLFLKTLSDKNSQTYYHTGRQVDSVFKAIVLLDAAIKYKVDSLYAKAYSVSDTDNYRCVVHQPQYASAIVYLGSLFLFIAVICGIYICLLYGRTPNLFSWIICIISLVVLTFGNLFSEQVSTIFAKRDILPIWEQTIREAYAKDVEFQNSGKTNAERKQMLLMGADLNITYLKAFYTVKSKGLVVKIDDRIRLTNSVLFAPVCIPSNTELLITTDISPIGLSRYNFAKILFWNRMTSRGVIQGDKIDEDGYKLKVNNFAGVDIDFIRHQTDSLVLIEPYSIPLDILKKIRPIIN